MLRKLLAITAISVVGSAAAVSAQDAPTAPKDKAEKRVQRVLLGAPFERSYLGIQTVEISKENYAKFGLAQVRGVGIEKVVENSPAANAGLQNGDVIVRFEGEEIKSVLKLTRLISEVAPEQTAKITVLRGGSEREFSVTLGKREFPSLPMGNFRFENTPALPALPRTPQVQTVPLPSFGSGDGNNAFIWRGAASRQIGVGVTALTKQLGDYFGVPEGRGLLINNVRENSPAANAGLKAGDIIVEAEGKVVKGQTDLIRALSEKKEGDVSLTIVRDRNRQTVRVTPEAAKDGAMRFEEFENLFEAEPGQMNFRYQTPQPPLAPLPPTPLRIAPRIL
jgi:S1-C subfamily serine protease